MLFMKTSLYAFLSLLCVFFSITTFSAQEPVSSFLGEYICKGHNPYTNNDYTMYLVVTKNNSTYLFQWNNENGYPLEYGTGITNPNLTNLMSVGFWEAKKPQTIGVISYQLNADKNLTGTWTDKGENKFGTEICTRK